MRLVYVCLSIQLGLDLKLNMGISEDEIKMERSRFLTSLCSSILYKYMPKKKKWPIPNPQNKKNNNKIYYLHRDTGRRMFAVPLFTLVRN